VKTLRLKTVDAYISFDFECPTSAGGTRLAPDVTERETQLLARAMSYKFAILGVNYGGAKAAIKATDTDRDEAIRKYCEEIRPLVESSTFLTATDLGTRPEDFASLPNAEDEILMHTMYEGMPLDAFITGLGVTVAAETALGSLEGKTVAIEGFGKVGGATALQMSRRGARLIAFSTIHGCVRRAAGFDVEELLRLRAEHGDHLVEHLDEPVSPAAELFEVGSDVLVPGARIGVIDEARAKSLEAKVIAPAANVPYTKAALEILWDRGIMALADFVCNSGATIGYATAGLKKPSEAVAAVEKRVRELTRSAMEDPAGPFEGARKLAEAHLRTWLDEAQMPDGPPLA
jgi:glutamate dehydrogenase/leucine dehydrogenase